MSDRPADSPDVRTMRINLERDPQAPSLARGAITGFIEKSRLAATELATLTLLVSELVSNAVLHSDAPPASAIELCAHLLERGAVRVEVIDRGSGFIATPRDPTRAHGGYGLFLLEQQATRWGVDRERGTCVWFELTSSPRTEGA